MRAGSDGLRKSVSVGGRRMCFIKIKSSDMSRETEGFSDVAEPPFRFLGLSVESGASSVSP